RQRCALASGNFFVRLVVQSVIRLDISPDRDFRPVNSRAGLLLLALVVSNSFLRIATKLFGNLAADGPDFFQCLVTFRFHNPAPAVAAALPATACADRARR